MPPVSSAIRLAPRRPLVAFCCLVFSFLVASASAETAVGTISGRVTNKSTGYALEGAIITVPGTNLAAVTQRGGGYSLQVPAGTQTLAVAYTGLDDEQATVTVEPNGMALKDFELTSTVYKMESFAVKGVREGNASALQKQRIAINPKTVVAADAYGVPAANPGELIQRLPGISVEIVGSEVRTLFVRGMNPDFVTFQVDGNQMASSQGTSAGRQFQIEQMGTGNIESVEIVKANTPDRDANAVAGFVNLVTRRGFDLPGERITLTGGVLWRDRNSSTGEFKDRPDNLDLYGVQYSNTLSVLGGQNNLGIAFNFNRRRSSTTQDETGAAFNGSPSELNTTNGLANSLWRQWGAAGFFYPAVATNVGLNLDYKLGPKSFAYVRLAGNLNYQYQKMHRWDIQVGSTPANFTATSNSAFQEALPVASSFAQTYSSQFTKKSRNYSINPGVSLNVWDGTGQLDIDLSHSYAMIWYPGYHLVTSKTTTPIGWSLDFRGQDQKLPILAQTSGPSWSDPASYTIQNDAITAWHSPDTVDAIKVDFRKELPTSLPAFVKVGVKYWIDDRAQDTNSQNLTWAGPAGIGTYTDSIEKQLSGRYGPFPFIATPNTGAANDVVTNGYFTKTALDYYNGIVGSRSADARFKEAISALYAMGQVKINKWTLMGGVRLERTDTTGKGWINTNDPTLAYSAALSVDQNIANAFARFNSGQTTRKGNYNKVHPTVQVTYEPLGGLIIRGSYTRSISRPPAGNILPITTVSLATTTVSQGNPSLKPFLSNNLDFSIEKYFEPVGQFSIGFFDKQIRDYIVTISSAIPAGTDNGFNGQYVGYTYSRATNIGSAHTQGWELNYQQQFSFLPGPLKGLGVQANHTILKSSGNYGTAFPAGVTGPLAGMVPHQSNVGLFYTGYGWDVRLLSNIRSRFIVGVNNATDLSQSTYRDRRSTLDFKARYTFSRRYDVFLNVDNITDVPTQTGNYLGRELFTLWQGTGYTLGFNIRL